MLKLPCTFVFQTKQMSVKKLSRVNWIFIRNVSRLLYFYTYIHIHNYFSVLHKLSEDYSELNVFLKVNFWEFNKLYLLWPILVANLAEWYFFYIVKKLIYDFRWNKAWKSNGNFSDFKFHKFKEQIIKWLQ